MRKDKGSGKKECCGVTGSGDGSAYGAQKEAGCGKTRAAGRKIAAVKSISGDGSAHGAQKG